MKTNQAHMSEIQLKYWTIKFRLRFPDSSQRYDQYLFKLYLNADICV